MNHDEQAGVQEIKRRLQSSGGHDPVYSTLIETLNKLPLVDQVWYFNGSVYGKQVHRCEPF